MVCNILSEGPHPSGRDMYAGACAAPVSRQLHADLPPGLLSFLESQTPLFLRELWGHLRSAEANALPGVPGIPQFLLDAKRDELAKRDAANTRMQSLLAGPRFGDAGSALPPPPPLPLPPPPPLPKPPLVLGGDRQRDRSPRRAPRWDDRTDGPSKRERSRSGEPRRRGRHSRSHSRDRDRSRSRRRERRRGSDTDDSRERKHKRKHKHRSRKHRSRSRSQSRSADERRREADLPDVLPPIFPPPEEPKAPPLPLALWQQKLAADGEEP